MNSIIFCLLLVSMVVMNNVGVEARKQFIGIGILDPCRRPGGWHPGCPIHTGKVVLFIRASLLFLNPLGPIPAVCSRILRLVVLNSEVKGDPGVLDPCKRPGGPHRGCNATTEGPRQPANPYNRGCSRILRCRDGNK
ncbi:hypothetical protein DVH24_010335 [Malus domestica]|uniref:Uncharacterized protein n=1 Tax=Malus domestica TaxID=3750 RepID=A0A498JRE9_MALDO|nr:hypothetical protein DVH24_010335 [Malus domestica]